LLRNRAGGRKLIIVMNRNEILHGLDFSQQIDEEYFEQLKKLSARLSEIKKQRWKISQTTISLHT